MATVENVEPQCLPIPGGSFLMGCAAGREEEQPVHRVYVDAFMMAAFQVRNQDWARFMEATGHPAPLFWNDPHFNDPSQPVVAVNWVEAEKYCAWLTEVNGRKYRLPTEAEWEKAARGGRDGLLYPWGDQLPQARDEYLQRWDGEVSGPLPVGKGTPNPFGLFDICENVHEWCSDWFSRGYYAQSPEQNPRGPTSGERRASRGGAWRHHIKASRCAARSSIPPTFEYPDYGFRVVREIA